MLTDLVNDLILFIYLFYSSFLAFHMNEDVGESLLIILNVRGWFRIAWILISTHFCFFSWTIKVGATFMAAATSSPELFINSVGTFITKSDIGVGTVVGSAVFNVLAVPACCGLFAGQVSWQPTELRIQSIFNWMTIPFLFRFKVIGLDWWPLSRDCLMYAISVISLICVLQDNRVMWYEALILVFAYFFYISGELSFLMKNIAIV